MFFLLKRTVLGGFIGLLILLGVVAIKTPATPIIFTFEALIQSFVALGLTLTIDAAGHGLLSFTCGDWYRKRFRELAGMFRNQSVAAILIGATMAGVGEELVFRGIGSTWQFLLPSAIVFGLLHHIRFALWPFTLWAIWEGVVFAIALVVTDNLAVPMIAHFLHDSLGFTAFRWVNAYDSPQVLIDESPPIG